MMRLLKEHLFTEVGPNVDLPQVMLGLEGGYQLKDTTAGGNLQEALLETLTALTTF